MGRSAYIVECSVLPGAMRRADLYVYTRPETVEAVIRRALVSWTEAPDCMMVWVVCQGELVDAVDLAAFVDFPMFGDPRFDAAGLRARLPTLTGKPLRPGQSLRPITTDDHDDSYLSENTFTLFYGVNDLEQDDPFPCAHADPFEPSNKQSEVLAALRRAAQLSDIEDDPTHSEVLWSSPTGHLLCRDPDDEATYIVFTPCEGTWMWMTADLDEALALLPHELAHAARQTLDEPAADNLDDPDDTA
jgi:hypothetical protein